MGVCLLLSVECWSGTGLCDGLITRPEESYRLWCHCVWSWNLENEEAKTRKWVVKASKRRRIYLYLFIYLQSNYIRWRLQKVSADKDSEQGGIRLNNQRKSTKKSFIWPATQISVLLRTPQDSLHIRQRTLVPTFQSYPCSIAVQGIDVTKKEEMKPYKGLIQKMQTIKETMYLTSRDDSQSSCITTGVNRLLDSL
jgi:hypothetical protein